MRSFLRSALILILVTLPSAYCLADAYQVLVIHSYGTDYHWTRRVQEGFEVGLEEAKEEDLPSREEVEVFVEYMDSKRFFNEDYFQLLFSLYTYKYTDLGIDVVVTADDNALDFMLTFGHLLFPGVPVVFTGINDFQPSRIGGRTHYVGIGESYDFPGTIEWILELQPETDRLVVISDPSVTGRAMTALARRAESSLEQRLAFEYWTDLEPDELQARLTRLEEGTVILWNTYLRTGDGVVLSVEESLDLVFSSTDLPVYSTWDVVGMGIVGGRMADPRFLGAESARTVLQILGGEDPSSISFQQAPMTYIIDYRAATKQGISSRRFPESSRVINSPLNFIKEYIEIVLLTLVVFVLLVGIILLLLYFRRRDRLSRKQILESLEERTLLIRELYHRTKNSMQMLIAMLSLARSYTTRPETEAVLLEMESKVFSISIVHAHLYQSGSLTHIYLDEYLQDLTRHIMDLFYVDQTRIRLEMEVQRLSVSMDVAVPLGLLIGEMMSNSIKHAFPDREGTIRLRIEERETSWILSYGDDGCGLPSDFCFAEADSLGILLIREITENQLEGTIELEREKGLVFRVTFNPQHYEHRALKSE